MTKREIITGVRHSSGSSHYGRYCFRKGVTSIPKILNPVKYDLISLSRLVVSGQRKKEAGKFVRKRPSLGYRYIL